MSPISLPHRYGGRSWAGRRIGLLGGSFNPPHEGHLQASLRALNLLGLDQVWWLVSPQNPLKPVKGMLPLAERLTLCRAMVDHPRIVVTDLERDLGTRYTVDTLAALKLRYARTRFIWFMGGENMIEIRRWKRWPDIFKAVPVAIHDRPPYSSKVQGSLAAHRFSTSRVSGMARQGLVDMTPPAWAFFHTPLMDISSTAIRARTKEP